MKIALGSKLPIKNKLKDLAKYYKAILGNDNKLKHK